ncbi:MAG: hypothetical protein HPY82_07105 [Gammaproteobacteria bacterium]|nr:hypothetical protein [Gammaproteobacteria bacterium]
MVRSFFEREFWLTVIFQSIDSSAGFNMVNVTVAKKLEGVISGKLREQVQLINCGHLIRHVDQELSKQEALRLLGNSYVKNDENLDD